MLRRTDYLTRTYAKPEGFTLAVYERELGGYEVARRVLKTMTREQVVDEAKKANLRGRGGAGFPMGVKWSFMPKVVKKPHYLVVNADEGEPGTHKDRTLMEQNPHACVEGCIIACYAIGANVAYVYVRDELHLSKARLEGAIADARAKGYIGPFGLRKQLRRRGLRPLGGGRVHLRRGDLDAQLDRRAARRAAHEAALPRQRRASSAAPPP